VYTFELDHSHIPPPGVRNPKVDWNNIGLGYDKSPGSIFKSLREIMLWKGHSYIDILKMDIEGGEWNWIFKEGDVLERVGQLLIEIHVIGLPPLLYPGRTVGDFIAEIEKYDMRMFFKEINHRFPFCCTEMSFVQSAWDQWNAKKQNFTAIATTTNSASSNSLMSILPAAFGQLRPANFDSSEAAFLEKIAEKYYTRQKVERMKVTNDFKDFNPNFPCIW